MSMFEFRFVNLFSACFSLFQVNFHHAHIFFISCEKMARQWIGKCDFRQKLSLHIMTKSYILSCLRNIRNCFIFLFHINRKMLHGFTIWMVCNWMMCEFMILNKFMKLMMDSISCFAFLSVGTIGLFFTFILMPDEVASVKLNRSPRNNRHSRN